MSILQADPYGAIGVNWFPTDNIKLAAILFTLGFKLRDGMPCSVSIDGDSRKENRRWFFDPDLQWGEHPLTGALIDNWYRHKPEFEASYPDHPVTWMRNGLDAREWLVKVLHGESRLPAIALGSAKTYSTGKIQFAACLVAAGYRLLKYAERLFYFLDDGHCANLFKLYCERYDAENPAVHSSLAWRREVLFARDYMANLLQNPNCIPLIAMKLRGKHLLLSRDASRESKHELFSNL